MLSHKVSTFKVLPYLSYITIAIVMVTTVLGVVFATSAETDSPKTDSSRLPSTSHFMRLKLGSSQLVLEGLVVEDFEMIAKGAIQMSKMSKAAEWPRSPDKVYDHYSNEFRRLTEKLFNHAKAENLEEASFTYVHMTTQCINCHNYVRGSLRIANDPQGKPGTVRLIPAEWDE